MKKRAYIPQDIRSLGLLALCLALGLALGSCQVETPPVIGDTPIVVTEAPTVGVEPLTYPPPPTDTHIGYPPPGGPFVPPTPRPTFTPLPPTPTPWPVADLPPLPTYAPPGPFSGMRIVYLQKLLGYRTINIDGTDGVSWELPRDILSSKAIRVSLDGKRVLYALWNGMNLEQAAVWIMDPDGNGKQLLVEAVDGWYPHDPIWSPDGTHIAYRRAHRDAEGDLKGKQIWVMDAEEGEQRLVLDESYGISIPAGTWSHVFRWALNGYIYFVSGNSKLYAVSPEDGSLYRLMDNIDAVELMYSLAPDGVHAANRGGLTINGLENAGFGVVDIPGGVAGWSADGSWLAYQNEQGVWVRDVTTGEDELLLPEATYYTYTQIHGFSPGNRYLAFQTDEGLFVIDLESPDKQPQLLVEDPLSYGGNRMLLFVTWLPIP